MCLSYLKLRTPSHRVVVEAQDVPIFAPHFRGGLCGGLALVIPWCAAPELPGPARVGTPSTPILLPEGFPRPRPGGPLPAAVGHVVVESLVLSRGRCVSQRKSSTCQGRAHSLLGLDGASPQWGSGLTLGTTLLRLVRSRVVA